MNGLEDPLATNLSFCEFVCFSSFLFTQAFLDRQAMKVSSLFIL